MTKNKEQKTKDQACCKLIKQTDEIAFEHTLFVSGTVVLTHKAGTSGIERIHDIKNQCVSVCSRSTSGNHDSIERINTGLYKQIGNCENCILDSGRDTKHQNRNGGVSVKSDVF